MKRVEQLLNRRWLYHSLIWGLAGIIVLLFLVEDAILIDTTTLMVPSIVLTYLLFTLQDYWFARKQYVTFSIIGLLLTISVGFFAAFFSRYLYGPGAALDVKQWLQNMLFMACLVLALRMAKHGIVSQLALQKLQVENLTMELNLLKAQLNPHFLFNTINNICGVNQVAPEKSTEMLIDLAALLRYHLEFSTAHSIPIHQEVGLIESFIALEKMRLRSHCSVQFEHQNQETQAEIAPLLLLPFVENAFKHGVHSSLPSFIAISLDYTATQLTLRVENSIFKHQKVTQSHIGQKNTIKRLELLYPDKHELHIKATKDTYLIHLNIML